MIRKPGQDYYLKPMNCPFHCLIFRARGRSYRELPLRFFEFGTVYRYEKSGVMHGLTRVRGMTQDDAHIFCTREQMRDELASLLRFVLDLLADYGLDDFYLELSTRNEDKYVGSDELWAEATATLEEVATGVRAGPRPGPGRRRVLRPEDLRAGQGRARPDLADVDHPVGLQHRRSGSTWNTPGRTAPGSSPVMIHRALFGSIERFFAVLTEHYAGAFPAWLAPVQVVGIPVADAFGDHLEGVVDRAARPRDPGRGRPLRRPDAEEDPQPHHREGAVPAAGRRRRTSSAGAVSFRFRDGTQINGVPVGAGGRRHRRWIASRSNSSPTAEKFADLVGRPQSSRPRTSDGSDPRRRDAGD